MQIKRMVGVGPLTQEMAKSRTVFPLQATRMDSHFVVFGPSIWDGLEDAELFGLVSPPAAAHPAKGK